MKTLLWLDDYRNPLKDDWLVFSPIPKPFDTIWAKTPQQFKAYIMEHGLPDAICFDFDLQSDEDGIDCANWLLKYCKRKNLPLPKWNAQSGDPAARKLIDKILNDNFNFLK